MKELTALEPPSGIFTLSREQIEQTQRSKGWYNGFAPTRKGSPSSGNYGHKGIPGHRGGSLPGGGHGALGLGGDASAAEKQKTIERYRGRRDVERPETVSEQALEGEISEVRAYLETVTDETERQALQEYESAARDQLRQEIDVNDALWRSTGKGPDEATEADWSKTADDLEAEGYALYQQFDKEGIELRVQEERGAQPGARQEIVGGQWVTVHRGAFSRREATRIVSERWADAKDQLSNALGQQLRWAGYSPKDIANADLGQRVRLLRELGEMRLSTRSRNRPISIDGVPIEARRRVVAQIAPDMASTAAHVATSPLEAPGLGAYSKMSLADLIRQTYLSQGGAQGGGELQF